MTTTKIIKTFSYDMKWGGGFGWIVLPFAGSSTALATSERASHTQDGAFKAAQRWIKSRAA